MGVLISCLAWILTFFGVEYLSSNCFLIVHVIYNICRKQVRLVILNIPTSTSMEDGRLGGRGVREFILPIHWFLRKDCKLGLPILNLATRITHYHLPPANCSQKFPTRNSELEFWARAQDLLREQ